MNYSKRFICAGLLFLGCFLFHGQVHGDDSGESEENRPEKIVHAVWAADKGLGEQVFFSTYTGSGWCRPVQLSTAEYSVLKPVSGQGEDGVIWVVWPQREEQGIFLYFVRYADFSWSRPRRIETDMTDNRAVSLVVDEKNTPWIAWTGSDDSYSDVFCTRYEGGRWHPRIKVNRDNSVPDLSPRLDVTPDGVLVSWKTYVDGKYVLMSRTRVGDGWSISEVVDSMQDERKMRDAAEGVPSLPPWIGSMYKATLFFRDNTGVLSIPASRLQQK